VQAVTDLPVSANWRWLVLALIAGAAFCLAGIAAPVRATSALPVDVPGNASAVRPSDVVTHYTYLPFIARPVLCTIPDVSYEVLAVPPPPTDRPAEEHADLNLALRGYESTSAYKGLVDYGDETDPNGPPQLPGLFSDNRTPTFSNVYQVHHWDWGYNCRAPLISDPPVTLAGLAVTPGETIHVPASGYDVGGYEVLVLYASAERITLKYTREDSVARGYALHVENVCVEPRLLALYQSWNAAGRGHLPALRAGQPFGRARDDEIGVAIRDTGAFMDPRSRNDWWQGW
jgi:hypothetical protein